MPNFWSKAGQFISEKISGTRTQDEDILKACEKMKITEKGLSALKTVLQNFISYSENFKKYFSDFNAAIKLIYNDSPFSDFSEEITVKHQIIIAEFEEMNKKMNHLFSKTSEWSIVFDSARDIIKTREEKRKIYDHYEGKLSKLNKSNKKDQKYIERNEEKFSKAASEYVEISEKTFNVIENSLKVAYELANPIIDEIITTEKKLFEGIGKSLDCFSNNNERFQEIKNNIDNPNINRSTITYDPMKYMNEKDLMKKISLNRTLTSKFITPKKRLSNPNVLEQKTKIQNNNMALFGRMSCRLGGGENTTTNIGTENYNNIFTNSRMTNSFGKMSEEELNEFYSFEDDLS
jgi:hypothetical protein